MLYNKNNVSKINDKKILHKVGKQWKVISVALLMAIGGGAAVATHANADTTTANADTTATAQQAPQSANNDASAEAQNTKSGALGATQNNSANTSATSTSSNFSLSGVNSSTASEVKELEAIPQVNGASEASDNSDNTNSSATSDSTTSASDNNSANNGSDEELSVGPQSANAPRSASANSEFSYQSGDSGSAASYHAQAIQQSVNYASADAKIKAYVNSLNTQFPQQYKELNNNVTSASANYQTQSSNVTYYNKLNSLSNRSDLISAAATANHATTSDFVESVGWNFNNDSALASTFAQSASYANKVNSYATLISDIKGNKNGADTQVQINLANAKVTSAYDNANVRTLTTLKDTLTKEASEAFNDANQYVALNTQDQIARIESGVDNTYVNSLASSLGYNSADGYKVRDAISSAANDFTSNANGTATMNVSNASGKSVTVSANANLYQVLSNTNVMNSYIANLSKFSAGSNYTSLSNAASSAASALGLAVTQSKSASENYHVASLLASKNLNLGSIMDNPKAMLTSALSANYKSANNVLKDAQAIQVAYDNGKLATVNSSTAGISALASAQNISTSSAANEFNNIINGINANADNELMASNADYMDYTPTLEGANSANMSSTMSALSTEASEANATASSASTEFSNYAANSDVAIVESTTLASLANSAESSASTNLSNANKALTTFEDDNTKGDFSIQNKALSTSKDNLNDDTALANAYGMHVYNYAPKYITAIHGCLLHQHTDYGEDNAASVQRIFKGTQFRVLGVGFAKDGTLRYVVNVNGTKGFITANSQYTAPTYLTAGNDVQVNVLKSTEVYDSATNYTKPVAKVNKGDVVKGTVVSVPDSNFNNKNVYGAFTRIELDNGGYMTANTKYVQATVVNKPQASKAQPTASYDLVNF